MSSSTVRSQKMLLLLAVMFFAVPSETPAEQQVAGRQTPAVQTARARAAVDLTGTWVSVITEEWKYRMVTPPKGDYRGLVEGASGTLPGGVRITAEAVRALRSWDPAKDEAAGEQCKGYGAAGVTRLPGKVRISWQDDNTLKVEFEAGNQVRLFRFGAAPPTGEPTWQGHSVAEWEYAVTAPGQSREGNLKVATTHLRPQYSRKNGLPVSENAKLTDYLHVLTAPNGDPWLSWIGELDEPLYYQRPYHYSWQFKKVPDNSPWNPYPCSAY